MNDFDTNNRTDLECGKQAPHPCCSQRATLAERQGSSEKKKTDSSCCSYIEENPSTNGQEEAHSFEDEMKEYKDKYLRLLAEIDNTRKRMQKEKQEMTRFTIENVLGELLGPIDNMENALKFTEQMSGEVRNWAQGFEMILGQFKEALSNHGVTAFKSEGTLFDPNWHHAIETEETDALPEGTIIQEFVKGYKSGDRTIRPARVKVAIAPGKNKKSSDSEAPSADASSDSIESKK